MVLLAQLKWRFHGQQPHLDHDCSGNPSPNWTQETGWLRPVRRVSFTPGLGLGSLSSSLLMNQIIGRHLPQLVRDRKPSNRAKRMGSPHQVRG
ncbi:hypothetical protein Mapa_007327 [Marchantia paleacea]|nr:hypothetical protein Mapa_007327 [Marchantia paleacea]